jgi:adenine deaminase
MVDLKILHVASDKAFADLAVTDGRIVNVHPREIYPGGAALGGERIAPQVDIGYTIGREPKIIDDGGELIVPRFLDGHSLPQKKVEPVLQFL